MTRGVLGIVGVGLIGGSIGLRARENGAFVLGYDPNPAASDEAIAVGSIDAAVTREELCERAEVIVIAAHMGATLEEMERLRAMPPARAGLIVDVASVKAPVAAAAAGIAGFVATHPMAGSERAGAPAARADLFAGRTWAYVPSGSDELDARAVAFVESMGAQPLAIAADKHDRIVAVTSHIPQLLAFVLSDRIRALGPDGERLCGPAARELLRLSNSDRAMWREIIAANVSNVEAELPALVTVLSTGFGTRRAATRQRPPAPRPR